MKQLLILLTGCLPLLSQPANAARGSAKYSVPAESIDAGGKHATSVKYSNDGAIGAVGGLVTTNNATAEKARNGYIGQLYEVTGLIIGAASTNIPSGSSTQLIATARLDDGTFAALAATQVVWSVVSGPIVSVNAGGLATAGVVSVNTAATVRGDSVAQFGTLPLMILASGPAPAPRIVNVFLSGTSFIATGSNGVPGSNYYVLSSTNVALPLSNWTRLATNKFDVSGNFSFTNSFNPTQPQRFYLLQVP